MNQSNRANYNTFGFEEDEEETPPNDQPLTGKDEPLLGQKPSEMPTQKPVQKPVNDSKTQPTEQPQEDYAQLGFEQEEEPQPEKPKAGKWESAWNGLQKLITGPLALFEMGVNALEEPFIDKDDPYLKDPRRTRFQDILNSYAEPEDEWARRAEVAAPAIASALLAGPAWVVASLIGSQAGQQIREVWGDKDDKGNLKTSGWVEAAAAGVDILSSVGLGIGGSAAKNLKKVKSSAVHDVFTTPSSKSREIAVRHAIDKQNEKLTGIVDNFSQPQLRAFEQEANALSQNRYTELANATTGRLQPDTSQMARQGILSTVSPFNVNERQAGVALQEAANTVFNDVIRPAESAAYAAIEPLARDLNGIAPRALNQANELLSDILRTNPTPDQQPVIRYLENLIGQLGTETDAAVLPTTRSAVDLIQMVQKGNKAVGYGSQLRLQSHRLSPILSTLRDELGGILSQNPAALNAYTNANQLYRRNAQIWGTKYMRGVRFAQNPENITRTTRTPSNLRNLKQAIDDPNIQSLADRTVVDSITRKSTPSAKKALNEVQGELGQNGRNAAAQLIQEKDVLTNQGNRAAVRNQISKEAVASVNTGQRPKKALELMGTRKGYDLVRESLNGSQQSREIFQSYQRLFLEDMVKSITTDTGAIDFKKAARIFENTETRHVLNEMGGPRLSERFDQLQRSAQNFQRNIDLYSKPPVQNMVKTIWEEAKGTSVTAGLMHQLGLPWPVIVGLGVAQKLAPKIAGMTFKSIKDKVLSNPRALHYWELVSESTNAKDLATQLPKLIKELQ